MEPDPVSEDLDETGLQVELHAGFPAWRYPGDSGSCAVVAHVAEQRGTCRGVVRCIGRQGVGEHYGAGAAPVTRNTPL